MFLAGDTAGLLEFGECSCKSVPLDAISEHSDLVPVDDRVFLAGEADGLLEREDDP